MCAGGGTGEDADNGAGWKAEGGALVCVDAGPGENIGGGTNAGVETGAETVVGALLEAVEGAVVSTVAKSVAGSGNESARVVYSVGFSVPSIDIGGRGGGKFVEKSLAEAEWGEAGAGGAGVSAAVAVAVTELGDTSLGIESG